VSGLGREGEWSLKKTGIGGIVRRDTKLVSSGLGNLLIKEMVILYGEYIMEESVSAIELD
jgi:hypothetical protein